MRQLTSIHNNSVRGRIMILTGSVLILFGTIGILSFNSFFLQLTRIRTEYIPMAPDTGVLFLLYGILLIVESAGQLKGPSRIIEIGLVGLTSLYVILRIVEYYLKIDLTLEGYLFPQNISLNQYPLFRMSPITATLFLVTGLAYFISHSIPWGTKKIMTANVLGMIVANVGATGFLGY